MFYLLSMEWCNVAGWLMLTLMHVVSLSLLAAFAYRFFLSSLDVVFYTLHIPNYTYHVFICVLCVFLDLALQYICTQSTSDYYNRLTCVW